jgi:DeoR family glycerol-3-phosphate regulon repressor
MVSLGTSRQTVVIDIGTTAVRLPAPMPPTFRGTIVTPSLLVVVEVAGHPDEEVLASGVGA